MLKIFLKCVCLHPGFLLKQQNSSILQLLLSLFFLRERERENEKEHMHEQGRGKGTERAGDTESYTGSMPSTEPHVRLDFTKLGLKFMTMRS